MKKEIKDITILIETEITVSDEKMSKIQNELIKGLRTSPKECKFYPPISKITIISEEDIFLYNKDKK